MYVAGSFEEALAIYDKMKENIENVYICGGTNVYDVAVKKNGLVKTLYMTRVEGSFQCDTFFTNYFLSNEVNSTAILRKKSEV